MDNKKRLDYNDILRGNIEQTTKDGERLLQSKEDKLIWIDGNLIWGFVSLEKMRDWVKNYPDENARKKLVRLCHQWKMISDDSTYGYIKHKDDKSLWSVMFPNEEIEND